MFRFIKMYDDVEIPEYQTSKSSGLDLKAYLEEKENIAIFPLQSKVIPTGLKLKFDKYKIANYQIEGLYPTALEAQIRSRSGLAARNEIIVLNSPGTIDEDYEGEIKVILFNLSNDTFIVKHGDRIAQIVFSTVIRNMCYVKNNIRGEGGFGSTDK